MGDDDRGSEVLHVLLLSFGYRGAMAQYTAQLANALARRVEVTVVAPESDEMAELFDDVELRELSRPNAQSGWLSTMIAGISAIITINALIFRRRPDVVHLPFMASFPSAILLPFLRLHRLPLVGTVHDPTSHAGQEIAVLGIDIRVVFLRLMSILLDVIIVHGQESRRAAVAAGYPAERLRVFPHGLYSHFRSADLGDDPILNEEHVLLFFGKIRPNKGFDRIPELVDGVAEEVDDVIALVAGTSDVGWQIDRTELEQTIERLRAHERVVLHDRYIPNEEVGSFFRSATTVVLPYYDATASGVAMTAYTFEKPVVATRTGDLGEMLERDQTGLVADPMSNRELVEKTKDLLTDPVLRNQLVENIRECKERYEWTTIADRSIFLYREVRDE